MYCPKSCQLVLSYYLRSLYSKYVFIDSGSCNCCILLSNRWRPIFCRMTRLHRSISGNGSARMMRREKEKKKKKNGKLKLNMILFICSKLLWIYVSRESDMDDIANRIQSTGFHVLIWGIEVRYRMSCKCYFYRHGFFVSFLFEGKTKTHTCISFRFHHPNRGWLCVCVLVCSNAVM